MDAADDDQRSRLLSALFESIDAEALPQRGLRLVAAPRGAWRGFFQSLVLELHTGPCSNLVELTLGLKQFPLCSGSVAGEHFAHDCADGTSLARCLAAIPCV